MAGVTGRLVLAGDCPHGAAQIAGLLAALPAAGGPDGTGPAGLDGIGLQPLDGARNNRVYRWSAPGGAVCVKVYKVDDRRRADREWHALSLLAAHRIEGVPRPLWRLEDPRFPVVGMSLLPGRRLPELADPGPALPALAVLLRRLQELPLVGAIGALPRVDSAEHYLRRIEEVWAQELARHEQDGPTRELTGLLGRWRASGDAHAVRALPAARFSRGDSNLLNWSWTGDRIGVVDFEYSGYADPVFDAADLVEHISARPISEQSWQQVIAEMGITPAQRPALRAARRTCAMRWLAVLWKHRSERPADFAGQLDRVRELYRTDQPVW